MSVILSAKNEADRLEACFASLDAQKTTLRFDVHLVDNLSSDGTFAKAKRLAAEQRRTFHVWKEVKPGAAAARNYGARKAEGRILVFTDAHCTFTQGWLEALVRPLLTPQDYPLAAVGGRTTTAFRLQDRPNFWERYLDDLASFWERDRRRPSPLFLPYAPVANFAVRQEVFLNLGGFDERWKTAAYDVDFCWRLSLCGFVCGYAPDAVVKRLRIGNFRALFRQMETHAFYTQALLATFERDLGLSRLKGRKDRFLQRRRRSLEAIRKTRNLSEIRFRALDALVNVAAWKGALEARVAGAKGDGRLSLSRRGTAPKALRELLPRGYQHLHRLGWTYWKSPMDVNQAGDLMMFRPRTGERYRMDLRSWKVWAVKAERGQSEDAALALAENPEDPSTLRSIDHLTLTLHTRRMLPGTL